MLEFGTMVSYVSDQSFRKFLIFSLILLLLSVSSFTVVFAQKTVKEYIQDGIEKAKLGDFKEAIEDFNKALIYNPVLDKAFHNRGLARYNLNDFYGAIEDFNHAIEQNTNYISAYRNRGLAELATNNKDAACNDWIHINKSGYSDANDLISQYCNK